MISNVIDDPDKRRHHYTHKQTTGGRGRRSLTIERKSNNSANEWDKTGFRGTKRNDTKRHETKRHETILTTEQCYEWVRPERRSRSYEPTFVVAMPQRVILPSRHLLHCLRRRRRPKQHRRPRTGLHPRQQQHQHQERPRPTHGSARLPWLEWQHSSCHSWRSN